ncbi:MAG: cyclomaltodextrinase N-terminal domain-containing protein, partial [Saprospiraceae bacterium]|nr:cyclomaltodextrinase N-terminal domain-containing protein [Saprospiraceae bacterium]
MKYSPLTTLTIAALFLSISWGVPGLAQRPATIYDDDPAQKIPLGLSKPAYARIEADGGPIDQIRVEPPFWWVGMQHPILEVLIYDQDIRDYSVSVDYPGVKLNGVTRLENPNYLFLELEIG